MAMRPIVVFSDVRIEGVMVEYLQKLLERTQVLSPDRSTPQALEDAKQEAVAWIARLQPVREADLRAMPKVRLISAWGVGYDHIDVDAATARRIPVCINPVFSRSVAEAALTLILALAKRLPQLMNDAHTGRRPRATERGMEVRGKKLGIIGFGRIGREIGKLGQRLDMKVTAHDPYLPPDRFPSWCQPLPLHELLKTADFVVVSAPLTPETYHLISASQLAIMRPSAFLINIARGPLVDEAALLIALQERRIAGAGLDVWEEEPVRPDHPLLALDNVIGTPHYLGATWESLQQVCESIQSNIFRILTGRRPKFVVNPQIFE